MIYCTLPREGTTAPPGGCSSMPNKLLQKNMSRNDQNLWLPQSSSVIPLDVVMEVDSKGNILF